MLASSATTAAPYLMQLESLAAEVDALTDVETLLQRYSTDSTDSTASTASLKKGEQYSVAEEERQMAAIAQLDSILSALQLSPHISSQLPPNSRTTDHESQQRQRQPIERADADDDDLTFITQLVRNYSDTHSSADGTLSEHKESVTTRNNAAPTLHAHARLGADLECETDLSSLPSSDTSAVLMGDGEGFRVSRSEADRLADIDALLAALQCEEREGKKRRFVHVRSNTNTNRLRGPTGRNERRTQPSLPALSKPANQPQPVDATSAHSVAALSLSSTSANRVTSPLSPPLTGAYCIDERQQLSAVDAQLAAFCSLQPQSDSGGDYNDEWLPLEHSTQQHSNVLTAGNIHVRPLLPPEQSWLYVSRLRDMFPHNTPSQSTQQLQCDDDPFSWLDTADADCSQAAVEQLDAAIERNSLLPDTDSEEDDEAAEEKQQTSHTAWRTIRALPAAPPTSQLPMDSPTPHTDNSSSSQSTVDSAGATMAERERSVVASSDAARRRVRRLIAEAEERKQAVRQQQHQPLADSDSGSAASMSGRAGRVRTSEERSGAVQQRKAASVLLSALPQRPPTR